MTVETPLSLSCPIISELLDEEQVMLNQMWNQWSRVAAKNYLIDEYYNQHRFFRSLGISVPPEMRLTRAALDWPAKAVQALARKHQLESITLNGQPDPYEVGQVLAENRFEIELPQAITACYKHAVSFLTVTAGNGRNEPDVIVQARDAHWATGLWDNRRRCLKAALCITDVDRSGFPNSLLMFFEDAIIRASQDSYGKKWVCERQANLTRRILVEPLVYDPQLGRPFGHSRISRTVRYLTDLAARTLVRAEVSSEFFSSPQRYALGVDEDTFEGENRWSAVTGRLLALTMNEDGQVPQVGTFPQISMEPHLAMYRQLAQNFCAATNLPQSSVGVFADNPASAEAMQAAEYALSDEAEYQWRVFAPAIRRTVENIVMVRDGLSEPPSGAWKLQTNWVPPRYVSPQAAADSIVKIVQALPQVADTNVALRRAGFTQSEIDEIQGGVRAREANDYLDRLVSLGASASSGSESVSGEE